MVIYVHNDSTSQRKVIMILRNSLENDFLDSLEPGLVDLSAVFFANTVHIAARAPSYVPLIMPFCLPGMTSLLATIYQNAFCSSRPTQVPSLSWSLLQSIPHQLIGFLSPTLIPTSLAIKSVSFCLRYIVS